jgi:hypothetical protein
MITYSQLSLLESQKKNLLLLLPLQYLSRRDHTGSGSLNQSAADTGAVTGREHIADFRLQVWG